MFDPNTLALVIARVAAARDEALASARIFGRDGRKKAAEAHIRRAHAYQDVLDIIANQPKG